MKKRPKVSDVEKLVLRFVDDPTDHEEMQFFARVFSNMLFRYCGCETVVYEQGMIYVPINESELI